MCATPSFGFLRHLNLAVPPPVVLPAMGGTASLTVQPDQSGAPFGTSATCGDLTTAAPALFAQCGAIVGGQVSVDGACGSVQLPATATPGQLYLSSAALGVCFDGCPTFSCAATPQAFVVFVPAGGGTAMPIATFDLNSCGGGFGCVFGSVCHSAVIWHLSPRTVPLPSNGGGQVQVRICTPSGACSAAQLLCLSDLTVGFLA